MNEAVPKARETTFPDLTVGDTYAIERTFTAADVQDFAILSGDLSPLHVDPVYAATTEFGCCVVHGMLLASLFSQLVGMYLPGKHALYLGQDLAFRRPVKVGERVTASIKVTGKNEATRSLLLATEIRNAEDKPVVSGTAKVKMRDAETAVLSVKGPSSSSVSQDGATVALVTGASRGIGAEIARVLAARGARVVVNYHHSAGKAESVVAAIRQIGGTAEAVQADVREAGEARRLVEEAARRFGRLDWVVNCAIGELPSRPFLQLDWKAFEEQIDYQLKAVVHVCQAAHPLLKTAGGGAIVNILSQVMSGPPPANMASYVAAKHGLYGLSKALAVEWAEDQIRVNMVSPGLAQTDLTQHYHDRIFKMEASRTPLRRIATPADIAQTVCFLLSKEAAFLTGVNVFVTGGQVMT
jgi:3-oxoacyl-[acyl-carrier protein] reductase